MSRPAVGAPLQRCTECGGYEYSGAPECVRCRALVDAIVEDEWFAFRRQQDVDDGHEGELATAVVHEPHLFDWRVVDAAYDRLACDECGQRLSRGPASCSECEFMHGFRYAAIETDRPAAQPGNEHGVRVNVSVLRRPQAISESELVARRFALPVLLIGLLPTTEQAQRISALIKKAPSADQTRLAEQAVEGWIRQGVSRSRR